MTGDVNQEDPGAYRRVVEAVHQQIVDGTLCSGQAAPSITSLSERYGHARQDCAKGLRMLEDEGLLTRVPGLGYYIK